eukprot:511542-Prymnesium_polylepis.1
MPRHAQLHATGRGVSITCSASLVRLAPRGARLGRIPDSQDTPITHRRTRYRPPPPRLGRMIAGHATGLPTPDPARWGLVEAYPDALGLRGTCVGAENTVPVVFMTPPSWLRRRLT